MTPIVQVIRRDNAEHVRAINGVWGERVAWLDEEEGSFEIKSLLVGGRRPGKEWVPPFRSLKEVRSER